MIHPTAILDENIQLGENVEIGPYVVIEGDVIIGEGTKIGSHAIVASGARIGKNSIVHGHAVVGTIPQDLKFKGEETTLEIGDRTVIREFATLNRGTSSLGKTVVGSDCLIMAYAHVAHDCVLGDHVIMSNSANLSGHVTVEDWAIIGGLVPVHQFVKIGRHSFIGGGYRVPKDVPPFIRAAGEPLKPVGLNTVGLQRRGFSEETLKSLKGAYRLLFKSSLNTTQAIEAIRSQIEMTDEINQLVSFIESCERGIIK